MAGTLIPATGIVESHQFLLVSAGQPDALFPYRDTTYDLTVLRFGNGDIEFGVEITVCGKEKCRSVSLTLSAGDAVRLSKLLLSRPPLMGLSRFKVMLGRDSVEGFIEVSARPKDAVDILLWPAVEGGEKMMIISLCARYTKLLGLTLRDMAQRVVEGM